MTTTPFVDVAGVGAWWPTCPGVDALTRGASDPAALAPDGASLGRTNRRRASALGRALADASAEAMTQAGVDPAGAYTVTGSSIAEAATMLGLLDQMWRHREPVSPAAFTVSVHNCASGLISIGHGNRGFATSIAADYDTPSAALMEGLALALTSDVSVVVMCGDEPSPDDLVPATQSWGLLAAAIVLTTAAPAGRCLARMRILGPGDASLAPVLDEPLVARNPVAGLVDLVHAIALRRAGTLRLDRGAGRGYRVELR